MAIQETWFVTNNYFNSLYLSDIISPYTVSPGEAIDLLTVGNNTSENLASNEIDLTLDVVKQMISRTTGNVTRAIVDWKGLNAENKTHIFPILEEAGLEIVRSKQA